MGKMLKNEVAKNELKEVRHSEEWHKSGEKVKYRLADAMKSCMKKAPVEKITVNGYPSNLAGEEIPLGARILRVCDTFAALISDRPYRKAFSMEEAVALMIDEIKDFDVGVFLAFQRVVHGPHIEEIIEINKQVLDLNEEDIR